MPQPSPPRGVLLGGLVLGRVLQPLQPPMRGKSAGSGAWVGPRQLPEPQALLHGSTLLNVPSFYLYNLLSFDKIYLL